MRNTLLILDGNNYLKRHDSVSPLTFNGMRTGGIKGVMSSMNQLMRAYQPTDCALVFDAIGRNFRHDLYPEYKGERTVDSDPDHSMVQQQKIYCLKIGREYGWNPIMTPGVEADDVIGTLSTNHKGPVVIASNDKDFSGLVSERVKLHKETGQNVQLFGPDELMERYGITPDRFIEYLMLVGDAVDNVKGCNDVGHDTAVKWLKRYRSLEHLIDCAEDLTKHQYKNLMEFEKRMPLVRQLITLKCDVPEAIALDTRIKRPNTEKLYDLLRSVGFHAEVAYIKSGLYYSPAR